MTAPRGVEHDEMVFRRQFGVETIGIKLDDVTFGSFFGGGKQRPRQETGRGQQQTGDDRTVHLRLARFFF